MKVVGGVKFDELVIDFVIVISIVFSFRDIFLNFVDCFIGEVGLIGEVCWVLRIE